ncbi:Lin1244/Lin1753 domain-containing protein [Ornithinibacillus bavariensis]|uniref:Lin1244/Lin1753 domain-containing protein n=1 Tax=Ornithinibacillus bavariensis TaxID=545502 RepID=UPI003D202569
MARPTKDGLDYFPLDVDMDQDDKVLIIISKFGFEGFGILVKLLMEIYKNGYFYQWTEKEQIIFSSRVYVDTNKVTEIVNECIKWGLFNQEKYEEHKVLTSKGIQERYLLATSRRVNVNINEKLRLVSVDINSKSVEKKSPKSTQSKVKESKENKSIKQEEEKSVSTTNFFDKNIAPITERVAEQIKYWEEDLSPKIVIRAMEEAIDNNARNWKYINSILLDWNNKGAKTLNDVERIIREFEEKKKSNRKSHYQKPQSKEVVPDWFKDRKNKSPAPVQMSPEELEETKKEMEDVLSKYQTKTAGGS